MKICSSNKCINVGIAQTLNNFTKNNRKKDGLSTECKECQKEYRETHKDGKKEYQKQYHIVNNEKRRNNDYIRRYGISYNQKEIMAEKQSNLCAICFKYFSINDLCVDHNHETNQIRELLCKKCNQAFGMLNEDIQTIENMIKYKKRHT
jgi:hypothetical protein